MTDVPKVPITTVDGLFGCSHRNAVLLCILYGILTALDVPFTPWCHHCKLWIECKKCELEPHLPTCNVCTPLGDLSAKFSFSHNE
jgi:hypothetical protein